MAFKPNYNHERAERERAKQRKQQEKARRRESDAAAAAISDPTDAPSGAVGETGADTKNDGDSSGT